MSLITQYEIKERSYYSGARQDYVEAMPSGLDRVLELGCGDGATGALALRRGRCREYIGIEMFERAAREAERVLTTVHVGNVETMLLPFEPNTFDALICSEVLEHLIDPEETLRRLMIFVRPGGIVFASSPNISHIGVIFNLLRGRFEYTSEGVMDRTHLRWFTPNSFAAMFRSVGVDIVSIGPMTARPRLARLFRAVAGPVEHLVTGQIDLRGRKRLE